MFDPSTEFCMAGAVVEVGVYKVPLYALPVATLILNPVAAAAEIPIKYKFAKYRFPVVSPVKVNTLAYAVALVFATLVAKL